MKRKPSVCPSGTLLYSTLLLTGAKLNRVYFIFAIDAICCENSYHKVRCSPDCKTAFNPSGEAGEAGVSVVSRGGGRGEVYTWSCDCSSRSQRDQVDEKFVSRNNRPPGHCYPIARHSDTAGIQCALPVFPVQTDGVSAGQCSLLIMDRSLLRGD